MNRLIVVLLAASTIALATQLTVDTSSALAAVTRKVYISATDAKGVHVTDPTAAAIMVKEGDLAPPVASLEPAPRRGGRYPRRWTPAPGRSSWRSPISPKEWWCGQFSISPQPRREARRFTERGREERVGRLGRAGASA